MSNKQSEAEFLAKELEDGKFTPNILQNEFALRERSAKELRRLHDVNTDLLEALQEILDNYLNSKGLFAAHEKARAAISKATGQQQKGSVVMTKEEIMAIARECGYTINHNGEEGFPSELALLPLMAGGMTKQAVRDFLLSLPKPVAISKTGSGSTTNDASREEAIAEAVAAEREACAQVCCQLAGMAATPYSAAYWMRMDCAAAIRARGASK